MKLKALLLGVYEGRITRTHIFGVWGVCARDVSDVRVRGLERVIKCEIFL